MMLEVNGFNANHQRYSQTEEARRIVELIASRPELRLPDAIIKQPSTVNFSCLTPNDETAYFPIPFKEVETTSALKAIEASIAAQLAALRYGDTTPRKIDIKLEKVACFLFQSYLATVGGYGKLDPRAKAMIKGMY